MGDEPATSRKERRLGELRGLVERMRSAHEAIVEAGSLIRAAESLPPLGPHAATFIRLTSLADDARQKLPSYRSQLDDARRRLGLEVALASFEFPGDADVRRVMREAEEVAVMAALSR